MNFDRLMMLCVLYKPSRIPSLPYIFPIQSGAAKSDWQSETARDNQGLNISARNETHSELTALYWAWKNGIYKVSRYVGVCHYRRYFMTDKPIFSRTGFYHNDKIDKKLERKIMNLPRLVENLLSKYDIITTKPFAARISKKEKVSLRVQFAFYHHQEDWESLRKCIRLHQPDYLKSFEEYENQGYFYQFNMFISNQDFFERYMSWIMSILEPLDLELPIREDSYQKRAIAFLSERLLGLYIYHHKMKVTWLPVAFID